MITTCSVCDATLNLQSFARCARCATHCCSESCLLDHALVGNQNGNRCEAIARGGGAEQFNAQQKYTEAVETAVATCAGDTAGQTCYICLGGGTEEGLVRGCACRGTAGFAHVSCLLRLADTAAEASDDFSRWSECHQCEQNFHGVVRHALGWACWKTYVSRPVGDENRRAAMGVLADGITEVGGPAEGLRIYEAQEADAKCHAPDDIGGMLTIEGSIANCLVKIGHTLYVKEACERFYELYCAWLEFCLVDRETDEEFVDPRARRDTLTIEWGLARSLVAAGEFAEALQFLCKRDCIGKARLALGPDDRVVLGLLRVQARALYLDHSASPARLCQAVESLENCRRASARTFGPGHLTTVAFEEDLAAATRACNVC